MQKERAKVSRRLSKCGDKKGGAGNLIQRLKGGQQKKFFLHS